MRRKSYAPEPKQSAVSNRKIFRFFWLLFCVVTSAYQGFKISEMYSHYEVYAETWIFPTDPIVPPMVTICIEPPPFASNGSLYWLTEMTSRQFFESVQSFKKIAPLVEVKQPKLMRGPMKFSISKNHSSWTTFKRSLTTFKFAKSVCHSTDWNKLFESYLLQVHSQTSVSPQLLKINLNLTKMNVTSILVKLSASDDFYIGSDSLIERDTKVYGSNNVLFYRKTVVDLLPYPYPTNCYDYRKNGISSQRMCLQKCSIAENIYTFMRIPLLTSYLKHDNVKFSSKPSLGESLDCLKKCSKLACRMEEYSSRITKKKNWSNIYVVALDLPREGDMKLVYKAKLTFWEFSVLLGSVFSLWFGLSVVGVVDKVLVRRKPRKKLIY